MMFNNQCLSNFQKCEEETIVFIVSYVLIYHQTLNVRSVVCMLPLTCVEHNGSNLHGGVDVLDLRLQLLVAQNLLLPLRQDGLCPNEFLAEEFLK